MFPLTFPEEESHSLVGVFNPSPVPQALIIKILMNIFEYQNTICGSTSIIQHPMAPTARLQWIQWFHVVLDEGDQFTK